jgi:hypothetical protein
MRRGRRRSDIARMLAAMGLLAAAALSMGYAVVVL